MPDPTLQDQAARATGSPRLRRLPVLLVLASACGGGTEPGIVGLTVSTSVLPNGAPGVPYDQALTAAGGDGTYVWRVSEGSLPNGLGLTSTGEISGTPTGASGTFTAEVQTGDGQTASKELTITINPLLVIGTESLPDAQPQVPYSESLAASGGDGSYQWTVTGGSLPSGLTLDPSSGSISGTTISTNRVFTARVTSGDGQIASRVLAIDVTLDVITMSLPSGGESLEYVQAVLAAGGDGVYDWALVEGVLPDGIGLDANTGEISGTTTVLGPQEFTVQVTSGDGQWDQQPLSLVVQALIGTIEWPFTDPLARETLPADAVIETYYNGFYNSAPCDNPRTTLAEVVVPWNFSNVTHRFDEAGDESFVGFAQCMVNGTDEYLGLGVRDVSGWGVEESFALDVGAPDLAGSTIDFIQLVVDDMSSSGVAPSFEVVIRMRWLVYGQ